MGHKKVYTRAAAVVLTLVTCAQGYVIVPAASRRAKRTELPARHAAVPPTTTSAPKSRAAVGFGALPLMFEANRGQVADGCVKFISRNKGYMVLRSQGACVR